MFFRAWFYVCKAAAVLFVLCIGGMAATTWLPEAGLLSRAILVVLIPMCVAGACLGVAVFVFGMRMRCPYCRRPGRVGGGGQTLWLECPHCGTVYGQMLRDFTLRVEPRDEQEGR